MLFYLAKLAAAQKKVGLSAWKMGLQLQQVSNESECPGACCE
jgi:hypothetical protein